MADERAEGASGPQPPPVRSNRRRRHRGPWHRSRNPAGVPTDRIHYAALDLGTNNCRLLVARPTADAFRVVDSFSRIVRLGEGLSQSGRLSDVAMSRAIGALRICAAKLGHHGRVRTRLIATEACRAAGNGQEFLARVRTATGLNLEVIDRETEARLAAYGCASLLDPEASGAILFDIGGGSSELAFLGRCTAVDGGPPQASIRAWVSLPMGVVTLAERHGGKSVTRESFAEMTEAVIPLVADFATRAGVDGTENLHLLGTSGTVTTMAGLHLELPFYERRRVDGLWLDAAALDAVTERLLKTTYEERVAHACIGAERADLVLAGCAILEAIRRVFPCKRLRVADRGLREGMLVEMMRADGAWSRSAST
ncbi:MAG: Ppx/GppA family phosphatase [Bradyrhizobiaceae bacterium]|nr:Ppx/GppA family phosphatase [Bradyrhizobiaceae bacterium]